MRTNPRGWLEAQLKGTPPAVEDSGLQNTATMVATIDQVRAQNRLLRAANPVADAAGPRAAAAADANGANAAP